MGTVTSGYASGTLTKQDREDAESLMNDVSEEARNPELDPAVASSINQTVSDGRAS